MIVPSLWLLFFLISGNGAAKIFGFFGAPSISHQITFQPVWKKLAERGHELVIITPDPIEEAGLKNLREIDLHDASYSVWNKHNISSFGADKEVSSTDLSVFINAMIELMEVQLGHPEVEEMIANKNNETFDLCIIEFMMPHAYAFKDILNCPMVAIASMPPHILGQDMIGNPSHPAYAPDSNLPYGKNLSFLERLASTFYSFAGRLIIKQLSHLIIESMEKALTNARWFEEVSIEISMVFANVNPVLNQPRPTVPAYIEFSGIHIKPPKELPEDLKSSLDKATEGIVYVSFGSNIKSSQLPKDKIAMLLQAFSELPYKVLWKFEAENLENKPENVEIRKWLPQQDVLRHPNVKLFVTQGGLQSLDEAMYSKIPVVVIPFFGDQHGNARKAVEAGIGETLKFSELSKSDLKATIEKVITDEKYKKRSVEVYNILSDVQVPALENVIWWIEYVIRHKGAAHLRCATVDMPLYQYFLLDVFAAIFAAIALIIFVLAKLCKLIKKLYSGAKNKFKSE